MPPGRAAHHQASSGGAAAASGAACVQLHPFFVVVRVRRLMPVEESLGAERFPRRADTGFRSIRPLLNGPSSSSSDHHRSNQAQSVAVVDPDGCYDATERYDRFYDFDRVFDERGSNEEVYATTVSPLVAAVRRGMNATCFAYGMTGAGKTYTMTGDAKQRVRGICSLAAEDLFDDAFLQQSPQPPHSRSASAVTNASSTAGAPSGDVIQTVHVSYLEIYNEKLRDLLAEDGNCDGQPASNPTTPRRGVSSRTAAGGGAGTRAVPAKRIDVIEDPAKGVSVTNLTEYLVTSVEQLEILMAEGAARRVMASTGSNQVSSRSHALLQLIVRRHRGSEITTGKLQLIDLAGSERAVSTRSPGAFMYSLGGDMSSFAAAGGAVARENAKQAKLRNEGANINRSLLALGACISALGNSATRGSGVSAASLNHVPYRDSKLTRLLKESLGGNTRTAMIAAVSPSCLCYEETLSTLKYASKARHITRTVRRNAVEASDMTQEYAPLISALEEEVTSLRAQLALASRANAASPSPRRSNVTSRSALPSLPTTSLESASAGRPSMTSVTSGEASTKKATQADIAVARVRLADLKAQMMLIEQHHEDTHVDLVKRAAVPMASTHSVDRYEAGDARRSVSTASSNRHEYVAYASRQSSASRSSSLTSTAHPDQHFGRGAAAPREKPQQRFHDVHRDVPLAGSNPPLAVTPAPASSRRGGDLFLSTPRSGAGAAVPAAGGPTPAERLREIVAARYAAEFPTLA